MTAGNLGRLRRFVLAFASVLEAAPDEAAILEQGGGLLGALVAHDDWLPDRFAEAAGPYAQHLLHCDSRERFSVVSFVWSPGCGTPIHDHTVWGLIGVLRGGEISRPYRLGTDSLVTGEAVHLAPGQVEAVSPRIGDIHQVTNAFTDRNSISIHVYGADIGAVARSRFDPSGQARRFVSGYTNTLTPNLWGARADATDTRQA